MLCASSWAASRASFLNCLKFIQKRNPAKQPSKITTAMVTPTKYLSRHHPILCLFAIVPVLNLIAFWFFAFKPWPTDKKSANAGN